MTLPLPLRRSLRRLRPLAGHVDRLDADRAAGWAVDPADTARPAQVVLHVDGRPDSVLTAALPREDVQAAGLGPLLCGFDVALPARLRDGAPHLVELRLGPRLLRGGRVELAAAAPAAAAPPKPARRPEGLVWLDRPRGVLAGWATGCTAVEVAFDTGPALTVPLDREVPGLGAGLRPGFRLPVPEALADGGWHEARVAAGDAPLDGAPLRFRLAPDRPRVTGAALAGRRLGLTLARRDGSPAEAAVILLADGHAVALTSPRAGEWQATLPPSARHLALTGTDGGVLARWLVSPAAPAGIEDASPALPPQLDGPELEPAPLAEARAAFAAFRAAPDGRFDPHWYAATHGVPLQSAFTDWLERGAAQGRSPGPRFDEAAARALHPAVARAVAVGALPCAFALELALGEGALGSLTGLPLSPALPPPAPPPAPVPARLPPPAAPGIHSTWLARLETDAATRAGIEADAAAARAEIAARPLLRRPLVSIIMPSWNRAFTIGEAIQSVLDQSYPEWELLVCDDASTDRTADVVRGFADRRIRYMQFQKSNGAGARNHGLRFARGEVIAYLDSDNLWHPLFLDLMLRRLMDRPGVPIAYSAWLDTEIAGAAVRLHAVVRPPFRAVQLSARNFMDLNAIVHHRRVTDWLGGFDPELPRLQDWDLALRHTSIFGAQFVDRIGVFYRRNLAWGQVTQTQAGSDAQDRVAAKTARRLAGAHERLALDWPEEGRAVVLAGPEAGEGGRLLAEGLARLAAEFGTADLVLAAPEGKAEEPADGAPRPETGPRTHEAIRRDDPGSPRAGMGAAPLAPRRHLLPAGLWSDPPRLAAALGGLLPGAALLTVGPGSARLATLPGAAALHLGPGPAGSVLRLLSDPAVAFPLGTVPLDLPDRAPPGGPPEVLLLGAPGPQWLRQAREAARRRGLALILPPAGAAPWRRLAEGAENALPPGSGALPAGLGRVGLTAVIGPVERLDPFHLGLLAALLARGIPAAVRAGGPEGADLAAQWLAARAAYALASDDPGWIMDKLAKLAADRPALARLAERSRMVQAVDLHPALARERLAHALWRMQFDPPRREVMEMPR